MHTLARCLGSAVWMGMMGVLGAELAPGRAAGEVVFTNGLAIGPAGRSARSVVHTDAVEAQGVSGLWRRPQAGDKLSGADGREPSWEPIQANSESWFEGRSLRGGYVWTTASCPGPQLRVLDAAGHGMVYVNGEPRAGDPYAHGYVRLPVFLRPGTNEFLFHVSRGRLRARLVEPSAPALLNAGDATLPDLVLGEKEPVWGAVVVLNASTNTAEDLSLRVVGPGQKAGRLFPAEIPPLGVRKVAYQLWPPGLSEPGEVAFRLELVRCQRSRVAVLDAATLKVGVRRPSQLHKRTFVSEIDGSVQYYAVNPPPVPGPSPALVLSVHGAGVEATGQAASYAPKSWAVIAAPTNRRPYGFDWEDWGRMDALEVLRQAQARYRTDPQRTYLTGRSMGGHGTWLIGATYPDRFAALGPSAGWVSFGSYGPGGRADGTSPQAELLRRAAASGDTLALATNYLQQAIYILHGDADDNVPVREARTMREHLGQFHRDFAWHEQPGAGHWWDASDEPGTDCVDWAPMFDLFARHRIPAASQVRELRFATVNPGVSSQCQWLAIEVQERPLLPSSVQARCDPGRRRIAAQTTNVARLSFDVASILTPGAPIEADLDGQKLGGIEWAGMPDAPSPAARSRRKDPAPAPPSPWRLAFERRNGTWVQAGELDSRMKGPLRNGPFKAAFDHRVVLVYGSAGTPAENAWALAKARFDAETFWYRGNGSVEVLSDTAYLRRVQEGVGSPPMQLRNVILYGHAESHAAWQALLGDGPVVIRRGQVKVGGRELPGEDLACLFIRPHPGYRQGLVGVVGGSGLAGMRLTERLPVFLSGAGLPDCLVVGPELLSQGAAGVRVAGFFGPDWSAERGEFAW